MFFYKPSLCKHLSLCKEVTPSWKDPVQKSALEERWKKKEKKPTKIMSRQIWYIHFLISVIYMNFSWQKINFF